MALSTLIAVPSPRPRVGMAERCRSTAPHFNPEYTLYPYQV